MGVVTDGVCSLNGTGKNSNLHVLFGVATSSG